MRLIDADALKVYHGVNVGADRGGLRAIVFKRDIDNAPTIDPTHGFKEFAEWVAETIFEKDFETNWTLGAFAEVACRKLNKLGVIEKQGKIWHYEWVEQKDEVEE